MTLLCKNNALYVKCCIIQNGVPDAQADCLDSVAIKKIFTTFNNQSNFEIYHNEIPLTEISLLENYISKGDEVIAGTIVPRGSWNAVIRVDNPTIKEKLLNNDFGGVSLNNRIQTKCSTGLSGRIRYSDIADAECVIPIYISFVKEPANFVGLHIMNYDVYIKKSKEGETKLSLLEDLKALIKRAEEEESSAEDDAQTETSTEEAETPTEPVAEDTAKVSEEEETTAQEEEPVETDAEEKDEEEESEKIVKEDDSSEEAETTEDTEETVVEDIVEETVDYEAEIEKLREEIKEIREELEKLTKEENTEEETAELPVDEKAEENADEPIITKSTKIEVTGSSDQITDFYARTGRDSVTGKRIRKQSRILN